MFDLKNTKCSIRVTNIFKKEYKKVIKREKDQKKFMQVLIKLANLEELDVKYNNHALQNNKRYKDCYELHIEPDWLLVYQYIDNSLNLLLVETGSHSDLFK